MTGVYMKSKTEMFNIKLDNLEITPDQWHHVLVSFDLSGTITAAGVQSSSVYFDETTGDPDHGSVSSECKAWVAVDDVNYEGAALRDRIDYDKYVTDRFTLGPHDIYTQNAIDLALTRVPANGTAGPLASSGGYIFSDTVSGFSVPAYNYKPGEIKTKDRPMGLPASAKYVDNVRHVEMAEFQLFTGVTLDTGVEANRRAFLDYERDGSGIPVKDENGKLTLIPVDPVGQPPTDQHPEELPAPAEKLLKKKPDILLHGSSKWIAGENTGTTGVDYGADPPQQKPAGQFQPTGEIRAYTPDPSLQQPS